MTQWKPWPQISGELVMFKAATCADATDASA
jgi:hypothetical protein